MNCKNCDCKMLECDGFIEDINDNYIISEEGRIKLYECYACGCRYYEMDFENKTDFEIYEENMKELRKKWGDYISKKFKEYIIEKYPQLPNDIEIKFKDD